MSQKQKIIIGEKGFTTYLREKKELQQIEATNEAILQKNEEYADTLEQLTSDPSYIESLSREKYGLVRPDEIIVRPPVKSKSEEKEK